MLVLMLQCVSSRVSGFPLASPCLCGKLQNLPCFTVSKQVVMWFCVAGVALRDIVMCLQTCRKWFCVAGAILLRRFQKMGCIFRGRRGTLETSIIILHFAWQSTLCTVNSALYTLHSTLHTLHFRLYTPHFTLYTPHFTLYTLHSTLYTLHFTLYTLHFTLYTLRSAFHTLHFTLHTFHFTL